MIHVQIHGAKDSEAEYEEATFNQGDERFRQAVRDFYDTGARIENIEDAIQGALEDLEAGE